MKTSFLLILMLGFFTVSDCAAQCNGYTFLCDRKYNEVAYLTTHNAYNSAADGFLMPNQNNSITQQLNDGVRAFMLDVYDLNGVTTVYHGFAVLGSKPLSFNLNEIKNFLDNNPNEIVSIILECYVTADAIETALDNAGLLAYCFAKDTLASWPTLQEMINAGERLVIFSDVNDASPAQPWYHYVWNYAVETHFTINDSSQFSCDYNRGDSINDLFILNHFVTSALTGTGSAIQAAVVNDDLFFINRIYECMTAKSKFPNFLTVDFYELGNTFGVLNTLNNMNWFAMPNNQPVQNEIRIWADISTQLIHIDFENFENLKEGKILITNLLGQTIYKETISKQHTTVDLSACKWKGLYFVNVIDQNGNSLKAIKILVPL